MLAKLRWIEQELSGLVETVRTYGIETTADLADDTLAVLIRELTIVRYNRSIQDNLRGENK
jgi:hypothetical protein